LDSPFRQVIRVSLYVLTYIYFGFPLQLASGSAKVALTGPLDHHWTILEPRVGQREVCGVGPGGHTRDRRSGGLW
jgi:hypothetical protein